MPVEKGGRKLPSQVLDPAAFKPMSDTGDSDAPSKGPLSLDFRLLILGENSLRNRLLSIINQNPG